MDISKDIKIGVVGIGNVGTGIAQLFAQSGFKVHGIDIHSEAIEKGLESISNDLGKLVFRGKISNKEKNLILSRISLGTELSAIRDADVAIEAIDEQIELKKTVFQTLDELISSRDALLLTNTSSLSVSEIASATQRPGRVCGMHFFNPVPVMKLVEVVRGTLTTEKTIEETRHLAELTGKTAIVSKDSPGFIVNRMLNALVVEAARIVDEGVGTIRDVDIGARLGCGHPMGPFELFDFLNAIPLLEHITDYMAAKLGKRFLLPDWVKDLVREGRTGKNVGKGFYEYDV